MISLAIAIVILVLVTAFGASLRTRNGHGLAPQPVSFKAWWATQLLGWICVVATSGYVSPFAWGITEFAYLFLWQFGTSFFWAVYSGAYLRVPITFGWIRFARPGFRRFFANWLNNWIVQRWWGRPIHWLACKIDSVFGTDLRFSFGPAALWFADNFDLITFGTVSYTVFYYLKSKRDNMEAHRTTFLQMVAAGLRVGATVAGLVDLGKALSPKALQGTSIIADLVKALAECMNIFQSQDTSKEGKPKLPVDMEWVEGGELGEGDAFKDDDGISFVAQIVRWCMAGKARIQNLIQKIAIAHGLKLATFLIAVLSGVLLYCWFHQRDVFEDFMEGVHRKGGNANKGKNARGKRAHRDSVKGANAGKKAFWKYYDGADVNAIVEVFYNGEPVSRDRIKVGQDLDPGQWVITRQYGNQMVTDELDVTGKSKSKSDYTRGDDEKPHYGGKTRMDIYGKRVKGEAVAKCDFCDLNACRQHGQFCLHHANCKVGNGPEEGYCMLDCAPGCVHHTSCVDWWVSQLTSPSESEKPTVHFDVPEKPLPKPPAKTEKSVREVKSKLPQLQVELVEPVKSEVPKASKEGKKPQCKNCGKKHNGECKKLESDVQYKCEDCGKEFSDPVAVVQHVETKHAVKKEALIQHAPSFDVKMVEQVTGSLYSAECKCSEKLCDHYVQQCVATWVGIVCNKHSYAEATHFKFGDKFHPKTKITHSDFPNKDLIVCKAYDGCPKGLPKKRFAIPEDSQKVVLIDRKGHVNTGVIQCANEVGVCGVQARATYSSEAGDCGGAIFNSNSSVVGFHFSAGRPKVDNLFAPVTAEFLAAQPKN